MGETVRLFATVIGRVSCFYPLIAKHFTVPQKRSPSPLFRFVIGVRRRSPMCPLDFVWVAHVTSLSRHPVTDVTHVTQFRDSRHKKNVTVTHTRKRKRQRHNTRTRTRMSETWRAELADWALARDLECGRPGSGNAVPVRPKSVFGLVVNFRDLVRISVFPCAGNCRRLLVDGMLKTSALCWPRILQHLNLRLANSSNCLRKNPNLIPTSARHIQLKPCPIA